jgi:uncharacterized membrane protein YcgQ (UPF0703/DUF1980 family)
MYKISIILIIFMFLVVSCTRTDNRNNTENNIIEISERMFSTHVSSIYMNVSNYLGKTIRLEGIFGTDQIDTGMFYYVFRYSQDDCCGGGMSGFEVRWAPDQVRYFPPQNSWVEATGVLREYRRASNRFVYLELSSLTVLNRRGAEYVTR